MFCGTCGAQTSDSATFCPACGAPLRPDAAGHARLPGSDSPLDTGAKVGVFAASFCISPLLGGLLGLVLYIVWKDEKPRKARDVCVVTLWGIVAWVVLVGLYVAALGISDGAFAP